MRLFKSNAYAFLAIAFAAVMFMTACKNDDVDPDETNLTLSIDGLEDLGAGWNYEGWIIVDGSPVSTGLFTVDADGNLSQTEFAVDQENLDAASAFVLSVEPSPDSDPAPSEVKYLNGDFSGNDATLGTGVVGDFSAASGKYFFATPTTTSTTDDLSGVWFSDFVNGAPVNAFELPTLGAGWTYEGWAVIGGVPVSTGTFNDPASDDSGCPLCGTDNPAPPFPGEDFINDAPEGLNFPVDLSGMPIVISVEPVPDNSASPFALKPLLGTSVSPATPGDIYSMGQNLGSFPSGSVTRSSN